MLSLFIAVLWSSIGTAVAEDSPKTESAVEVAEPKADSVEPVAPAEAPQWIDLDVAPSTGSALGSVATDPSDLASSTALVLPPPPDVARFRGRWGLRPWLGAMGLVAKPEPTWAAGAGVVVVHQWWPLERDGVAVVGQTRVQALFPFGGMRGWALGLDSVVGPWIGPIGLLAGPAMRADAFTPKRGAKVKPALGVGPTARVVARAGMLTPWVGATPVWLVSGDRTGVADSPFDELDLATGLEWRSNPIAYRLSASRRSVATGALWQVALGIHLRPF
jgi:hypothetical protein